MKNEYNLKSRNLLLHLNKNNPDLSLKRQAELLGIGRSTIYYQPKPVDPLNLAVMNKIDEIYTKRPYYGSRKIAKEIATQLKQAINRKRIQNLMREMGIEACYPKPNLSKNHNAHPIYPYLLKGVTIDKPNKVWGTDITYIRLESGFVYLTVYLDWHSRFVLSWELSNTLDNVFCLEAAERAVSAYGSPEITNSDQGVQYTSTDYINFWTSKETKISMDSRGRAMDNIFTERLWRSLKYEEVYLKNYQTVIEAREGIGAYLKDYNYERLHQALGYKTPAEIYFNN